MERDKKIILEMLDSKMWKTMTKEISMRISKHTVMSENLRKEGNEMFKSNSHNALLHEQAWKMYTMSIAVAEKNTEGLAMAYGNRSALLFHIGKFEACMKDIDRALEISKSNLFKIKLLCRKMECMHTLNLPDIDQVIDKAELLLDGVSEDSIKNVHSNLLNKTKLKLKKPSTLKISNDRKLETLENINKRHKINDFSSVKIGYCERHGRQLIATRDFAPGEVVYVEKPYTMFLNIKKLHAYCSHCFSTKWANIPCDHCSWTLFCSEECKVEAWNQYHDIECSVYGYSKKDDYNDTAKQLAIRLFIMALKEAGSLENLRAELEAFDKIHDHSKGFVENGVIKSQGFKSIYNLMDQVSQGSLQDRLHDTAMVLRSIAWNTTLFGENFNHRSSTAFKNNENVLFVGTLILKLSKVSQLNKHQMWNGNYVCANKLDRLSCWENECCTRGVYIAPITSLLNHSCDPNVRRCFTEDKTVVLYAIHPIKKGSQTKPNVHMRKEEQDLALKYRELVPSTLKPDTVYSEKDIAFLGEGIQKGLETLSKPAFTTVNLIICLNTIFERLCGIWLIVPSSCQKS
ncbi:hypothetical protein QAD02_008807 [Eretmocerus hayati]|uniref:Uncharacterized protein n=1 Tax=Eretmocerus hayati TaxID=131215 RepID=A0ACC2N7I3_9HYME|nr:hypothetical protein QAD02_008807 [Eretmocerus hayati]